MIVLKLFEPYDNAVVLGDKVGNTRHIVSTLRMAIKGIAVAYISGNHKYLYSPKQFLRVRTHLIIIALIQQA